MSFETARPVTPESFGDQFRFHRRPQVQYPVRSEVKQSVNISQDTLARAASRHAVAPHVPKLSYSNRGKFSQNKRVGQFLAAFA